MTCILFIPRVVLSFPRFFVFNENLKCNGQRLRRAKGSCVFLYNDSWISIHWILYVRAIWIAVVLKCSYSLSLFKTCGGKVLCYLVWIVAAKQRIYFLFVFVCFVFPVEYFYTQIAFEVHCDVICTLFLHGPCYSAFVS